MSEGVQPVDLLRAAIEGFSRNSYVWDRIIASMEAKCAFSPVVTTSNGTESSGYGFTHVRSEVYGILINALEARGTEETLSSGTVVKKNESIGCIEIRWQTHTRYTLHKPKILEDLVDEPVMTFGTSRHFSGGEIEGHIEKDAGAPY